MIDQHISAWWAGLRIPESRRWLINQFDMNKWALNIVGQENADELSHHIHAIAMWSHTERPGDPWPGFKRSVEEFFKQKGNTMAKKKGKTFNSEAGERIPCQFTGLSPGKEVFGLGIRFPRTQLTTKDAESLLCGSRLKVRIVKDGNADMDTKNQQVFENPDSDDLIESTVDVKSYTAKRKEFTCKFAFPAGEIDQAKMLGFMDEKGYVEMERIGDAEPKGKAKSSEEDEHQMAFEGGK